MIDGLKPLSAPRNDCFGLFGKTENWVQIGSRILKRNHSWINKDEGKAFWVEIYQKIPKNRDRHLGRTNGSISQFVDAPCKIDASRLDIQIWRVLANILIDFTEMELSSIQHSHDSNNAIRTITLNWWTIMSTLCNNMSCLDACIYMFLS